MLSVICDRDLWWRVARNGRAIRSTRAWWNLYRTRTAALAKLRAILRDVEG